jgi:hypothetical protein
MSSSVSRRSLFNSSERQGLEGSVPGGIEQGAGDLSGRCAIPQSSS